MARSRIQLVVTVTLLVALVYALRVLPIAEWLEQFKAYVQQLGGAGYVLYVLVYAICCVALVPASALTLGAGAIFGFAKGALVVLAGATLGASAAFILARTVLRKRVEQRVAANPKVAAVDRAIAREGTKVMLLMRISGFPPFTWINYALGLTGVSFRSYVMTTFFGMIPGVLAFTWVGAAGAAALAGAGNGVALIVTAVGAIVVSAYVARIATRAIRRDMLDAPTTERRSS